MHILLESVKRIGRKIGLDEEKGFAVAIFLALLIVSATVVGYYVWLKPEAESYNTIYLLDANRKSIDYPETLVANQNSTFNVYFVVENHMTVTAQYQVQVKITNNLSTFPVDITPIQVYEASNVKSGENWERMATITQNEVGSFSVIFELYEQKEDGTLNFKENYCVLNIQVTN
jgi:uncharacterized membrane protein